jgi:undecaprenyl pyrophosphate phosphatase UppP
MPEEIESDLSAPSPVVPSTPRQAPRITLAMVLIVLGAVAIVVSLFLHWKDISISARGQSFSSTANGHDVPVQFLFDRHTNDNDPSILIVLIPAAALGILGAALHKKALAFVGSIVSLLVAGLYLYQVNEGVDELNTAARGVVHISLTDFVGIAPYVCGIGAIVMLVGAFLDRAPRPAAAGEGALPPAEPLAA